MAMYSSSEKKLCGIPAGTLPPCDLEWGHDGDMHANAGDGFYALDYKREHAERQEFVARSKLVRQIWIVECQKAFEISYLDNGFVSHWPKCLTYTKIWNESYTARMRWQDDYVCTFKYSMLQDVCSEGHIKRCLISPDGHRTFERFHNLRDVRYLHPLSQSQTLTEAGLE